MIKKIVTTKLGTEIPMVTREITPNRFE